MQNQNHRHHRRSNHGLGIALHASPSALTTPLLEDVFHPAFQAVSWIRESHDEGVRRRKVSASSRRRLAHITTSQSILRIYPRRRLIIEAAPTNTRKNSTLRHFANFASPTPIFASNTSSLSISDFIDKRPSIATAAIGNALLQPVPTNEAGLNYPHAAYPPYERRRPCSLSPLAWAGNVTSSPSPGFHHPTPHHALSVRAFACSKQHRLRCRHRQSTSSSASITRWALRDGRPRRPAVS